jgi:nucleotide-binding universal stress UspA family protein
MPRFIKILCPVDFEPNSLLALGYAAELTQEERKAKATLDVLHVVPLPLGPEVAIPFEKLEGGARTRLERLARHRIDPKLRYTAHIRTGDPASEVIRLAEQIGADLIVMSTHGRRGLSRFFLGSVAERVVREAHCAVLTIKPTLRRGARRASKGATSTRKGVSR